MSNIRRKVIRVYYSLIKEESNRPKYKTLLQHPFIQLHEKLQPYVHPEVASYVVNILESMANNGITQFTTDQPAW
jgi:mitogen-activated protein kinase kinase 4